MGMTIGEAARHAGCTPPTIRYYESVGLLALGPRTAKGRRTFGWPEVKRLTFIRRAREFGLSIDDVRELLAVPTKASPQACSSAAAVVDRHLAAIRAKRAELKQLESSLAALLERCRQGCAATGVACSIMDDIGAAKGRGRP